METTNHDPFVFRYNLIPKKAIKGKILELGSGNRGIQLKSIHKKLFLNADYLGIDLSPPDHTPLKILRGDIKTVTFPAESFDLIIAFEVLEHIEFRSWKRIFQNIQNWLKPNGLFYFSVPHAERPTLRINPSYPNCPHLVFGIKEETLAEFFSTPLQVKQYHNPYLFWYEKGRIWGILRGIKRLLTRHPFLHFTLICSWEKSRKSRS